MEIFLNGICYVLVQSKEHHKIVYARHKLIWYPERGKNLLECASYIPYVKSIVTESPWLIGCYDREHVRVWSTERKKMGDWELPDFQTYGASINKITMALLGIRETIAGNVYDGGKKMVALDKELSKKYKNTHRLSLKTSLEYKSNW